MCQDVSRHTRTVCFVLPSTTLESKLKLLSAEEMMELATETFDFDLQRVFEECTEADCASRTGQQNQR